MKRIIGSAAVLAALLLAAAPARAIPLPIEVEGDGVSVRAEDGLGPEARRAAEKTAEVLDEIAEDLEGLPRVDWVEVRLVKHQEDLGDAAPAGHGVPEWAVGVAFPDEGVVVVAARGRRGDLLDVDGTLAHELAHMALGRALGRHPVPRWLTEGFAYLHSSDFSMSRAATLMGAVFGRHLVPIGALESSFPVGEDAAALAYAESYDFVGFLTRRGRWVDRRNVGDRGPFRDFLARLAGGATLDEAAVAAFGTSLDVIEGEWREDLSRRFLWYPLGLGGAFLWGLGAILLVLAWWRRRRQAKRRLAEWGAEEARQQGTPVV